jgi:hypothetical protein
MSHLRRQPVRAKQRVRQSPDTTLQLAQRLSHPPRQGQIIKASKNFTVSRPQPFER